MQDARMPAKRVNPPANRLLKLLSPDAQQLVLDNGEIVDLALGDLLCEHNQTPRHVYFPMSGLISLVVNIDEEAPFELAMIGWEGMLGATRILGVSEAPMQAVVEATGNAVRLTVSAFEQLSQDGTQLQSIVKRYLFMLMTQISRTAGCTHFHEVSNRLARWLLMTHDRSSGDSFYLTQQYLSEVLGVQRSAVSIAASALQQRYLINYSRGDITILDRKGLERVACSCYAAIVKDQRRFSSLAITH